MSKRTLTRVAWVSAFAVAVAGGIIYLVSPGDWTWYLATAAPIPFAYLIVRRGERIERETGKGAEPSHGSLTDGPWGPP
jgi:hypothetical protein